jgi:hypothetical protein
MFRLPILVHELRVERSQARKDAVHLVLWREDGGAEVVCTVALPEAGALQNMGSEMQRETWSVARRMESVH